MSIAKGNKATAAAGPARAARRWLRRALLLVSLTAWAMLLTGGTWLSLPAYCLASARFIAPGWDGLELAMTLNPPGALAAAWLTMLLAMMPPLLDRPLVYLRDRSLARRRLRATVLFLSGYVMVWMAAGAILVALAVVLRALLPAPGAPFAVAVLAACAWQVSPAKQACLNRCHGLARLSPFGLAADHDALRFGLVHGGWCAGACWALMALPLSLEAGHFAAMALVSLLLFGERQERPRPPAWRRRWPRSAWLAGRVLVRQGLAAVVA